MRSPSNLLAVGYELFDTRHHANAVADDGLAVHVTGEHEESEFGELPRAAFHVVVQPCAAMDDQNSRAGSFIAVPDKETG